MLRLRYAHREATVCETLCEIPLLSLWSSCLRLTARRRSPLLLMQINGKLLLARTAPSPSTIIAVVISDNDPTVAIDNIYFGPPIPAPGALAILAMSLCVVPGRRRCR